MKAGKVNIVVYVIIFIIFLLSAFFRIYNSSLFKVLVPLTTGILGIYFFNKGDTSNYLKFAIVAFILGHSLNQYFFTFLTLLMFNKRTLLPAKGPVKFLYILFFYGFVTYLLNQAIETNLLSFPFFVASFFLPIVFFTVAYREVTQEIKNDIIKFYLRLLLLLAFSALIQYAITGATVDELTGGSIDAHILGFHISIGFIYSITKILRRDSFRDIKSIDLLLLVLSLPVLYLADAKYLLLNALAAVSLVYLLFHTNKLIRPILICVVLVTFFIGLEALKRVEINISTKISFTYLDIVDVLRKGAKFQLAEETISLPSNEPMVFLIGSGPGTFLSRASNSRAYDTMIKKVAVGRGEFIVVQSKLPSFIPAHTSWVTHKYAARFFRRDWQGTLFDYRSSLISFFWEFGIVGSIILILFFKNVLKRIGKAQKILNYPKHDAYFIQSFIVFYLLNSLLAYYFEYTQTQVIFWLLIGIYCNKKQITEQSK